MMIQVENLQRRMRMKQKLKSILMVGVASVTLAGCGQQSQDSEQASSGEDQQASETENVSVNVESDITKAVDAVENSVVTVINYQNLSNSLSPFGGGGGPASGQQQQPGQQQPGGSGESGGQSEEGLAEAGTGSGAIYKVDGDSAYIFTNNHVIEGSDAVDVRLSDGTRAEAEVVGADTWTDLAVLRIDSENVGEDAAAEFGDSSNLNLGEPAIALGSPLGTEFATSVTSGVVSGVNRSVPVDIDMDGQMDWEMNTIQTDAAINPGNSGGPLVNAEGQIIGINSMKVSTDTVEGMGFAIPSNDARNIIEQLETNGEVVRPVLGVTMIDLGLVSEEQQTNVLNLPEDVNQGVLVVEVGENTSAANAELQPQDVITSFNGQEVTSGVELRQQIYQTNVGDEVEVEFYRDGEQQTATMTMTSGDSVNL